MDRVVTCRVISTTSVLFDFVPRKNKSCVLSRSCDLLSAPLKALSLLRPDSELDSFDSHLREQPQPFRYQQIETTARGVIVIVVGNGHGDTSSNPGRD